MHFPDHKPPMPSLALIMPRRGDMRIGAHMRSVHASNDSLHYGRAWNYCIRSGQSRAYVKSGASKR